jgi:diadenosine tetraphosphate (Ap4A) HIT family hydrolase
LASSENIAYFFNKLSEIANLHCPSGFRIITNNGKDADQTVEHFHVHIIGGAKLMPLAH